MKELLQNRIMTLNAEKQTIPAVLDGIGKGLDPRFDITEIAKP